jgi:hypothetical protein
MLTREHAFAQAFRCHLRLLVPDRGPLILPEVQPGFLIPSPTNITNFGSLTVAGSAIMNHSGLRQTL